MDKVLIIDDEQSVIDILNEVLSNAGFNVECQTDSVKALNLIKKNTYDIILTDFKMPKVDGIGIAKAAKEVSEDSEVIMVTGYATLSSAVDALKSQVFDYIFKPFSVSDILMTMQKVSDRIQLKKQNQELRRRIEKALSDMGILHDVCKIINASNELEEILHFGLAALESSLDLRVATIMLFDEQKKEFFIENSVGLTKQTVEKFKIQLNTDIIGQALRPTETVNVAGFEKDESFKKNVAASDKKKMKCFIAVPLNAQNYFEGLITLHDFEEDNKDDIERLKIVEVMAVQIAPMIRLGQDADIQKIMLTDSLFGAKKQLANTIKKAGEYRGALSILVFRLYLKKKGSQEVKIFDIGDTVFKHITNNISSIDSASKIGIDSFMVILQGKTKMLTETVATKIKKEAESNNKLKRLGFLLDYGYADFPVDGETFDVLISKAQENLWKFVKKA